MTTTTTIIRKSSSQKFLKVQNQIRYKEAEKKHAYLTWEEPHKLPDDSSTYKSIDEIDLRNVSFDSQFSPDSWQGRGKSTQKNCTSEKVHLKFCSLGVMLFVCVFSTIGLRERDCLSLFLVP